MKATHPLGEILRYGDTNGLRYERRLEHPPEQVARARTQPNQAQPESPPNYAV